MDKSEPYYVVGVIKKEADIVGCLSERGEMSIAEIGVFLGCDRNSVNRILLTLKDLGYVERLDNKKYKLTLKLLQLGSRAVDNSSIYRTINKYMKQLVDAFGETVCLGQRYGEQVVTIEHYNGNQPIQYATRIGNAAPLHNTALGKCILAAMDDDELEAFIQQVSFRALTPKSIMDRGNLRAEIEKTRRKGFGFDDGEMSEGLRCMGIAVYSPSGKCSQAISVSGPALAFEGDRRRQIGETLLQIKKAMMAEMNPRHRSG
jgi:IclR family KDG regulon transcriptional repressor